MTLPLSLDLVKHYHVMTGEPGGVPFGNLRYNFLIDSLESYSELVANFFGEHLEPIDHLELFDEIQLTQSIDGPKYVHTDSLVVMWSPCTIAGCQQAAWN